MPNLDITLWGQVVAFIGILILAAVAAWLLTKLLDTWIRQATSRSKSGLDDALLNALQKPVVYFVIVMGLYWALQQADFIINPDDPLLETIFFVLFVFLIFLAAYRTLIGLVDWYAEEVAHVTETSFDDHILPFFRRLVVIFLVFVVIIVLFAHFNINVSGLVATLGVTSLAVALAAKEVFSNMISGFIILIDQPFRIGDRIELEALDTWGDVQDISLHSTRILTRDHRLVSIPNSLIGKNRVVNHSIPNTKYRVQTHVSVAYGSDIEQVRQVLIEAIAAQDWVMKDERIEALFLNFQDSGLQFRVRCWIEHYVETRRVIDKMNTSIYNALHEAGIDIPFPQRVLHISNSDPLSEPSQIIEQK